MKLIAFFGLLLAGAYAEAVNGTSDASQEDSLPTLQELLPRIDDVHGSEDFTAKDDTANVEKLDQDVNDPFLFRFHRRRRVYRRKTTGTPPYQISSEDCWGRRKCGHPGGGKCKWCGKNGWCCRRGFNDCPKYLQAVADSRNHKCVRGFAVRMGPPVVTVGHNGERIRFTSTMKRMRQNRPARFEVQWYSNSRLVKREIVTSWVSYLENTDTKQYFILGYNVYTKVRGWYLHAPNAKSEWVTSNMYFAGFQFQPSSLRLSEGGSSMVIEVIATIPITVPVVYVRLTPSQPDVLLSQCTIEFTRTTSTRTVRKIGVAAKPDFVDRHNKLQITEKIIFDRSGQQQAPNNDWRNIRGTTVGVHTTNKPTGRCTSSGDPHMKTFDGITYNHYRVGEYVLAESKARKWSVHTRTVSCARASCNCGVAAREDEDVLVVDMCRRSNAPVAFYKTKQEPQHGTYIERSNNGKKFILKFKSGASVTFEVKIWRHRGRNIYYADVTVQSAPTDYGQTRGLCGNVNRDRGDDMVGRGGRRGSNCGRTACASYTESWKITNSAQSNFYYDSKRSGCLPKVGNKLCLCSADGEKQDNCNVEFSPPKFPRKPSATGGYKILGFPGRARCDSQRKVIITHKRKVIELPPTSKEETNYVFKPPTNFKAVLPSFPTKTGVTQVEAQKYCYTKIQGSALYRACKRAIGVNFNIQGFLKSCEADIEILDDKVAALRSAFDGMKSDCQDVLLRTPSLWKPGPNGKPAPPKDVGDDICPAQCSGNGECVEGDCKCNKEFTTEDCSVQLGVKPKLLLEGYPTGGYRCNIKSGDCNTVTIFSEQLVPDKVVCGFTSKTGGLSKVSGNLLSFSEVLCSIPKSNGGITYTVSLSNDDGTSWSTSHITYTIYDPSIPEPTAAPTRKPTTVPKPQPGGWTVLEDCRVMCGGIGGPCPGFCGANGYCCSASGNECPAEISSLMTGNIYSCSTTQNQLTAGNVGVDISGNDGGWHEWTEE